MELTGRFRLQHRVAAWAIRRWGAVVNEEPNRSLLGQAVLVGIGVSGRLDEIVLHQPRRDRS